MTSGGRRKSAAFFIVLGACLAGGALALNVGWIIVSWQNVGLLVVGVIVFPLVITGVVLNTVFLVREIRRNEQHEAFINAVTHELKTPVASTRLYLQTLQNRHVDEARRQEFYGVMLQDSDRLQATIEQVLRAGQQGARRRRSGHHAIDVSALVSECLSLVRTRHRLPPEAVTYLERFTDSGPRLVLGDEDELKAVVSNLVDNAIKYSGPQVRVAVELEQTDAATITLRVRESGHRHLALRAEADLQALLPDPRRDGHADQGHWPRPLHRPVRRGAARREGVRRERGTRPRQHVHRAAAAGGAAMSRILIVEDEQHLADGLRYNLEAEQYDIDIVDNGEEALKRLTADSPPYDVVILDVMLPGIDGFDVVAELRRQRRFVPVLMLTARGRSEDVLRGFSAGADDYLPKPFQLPILLTRVQGLLRRHEWFRQETAAQATPVAAQFSFRDKSIDFEQLEVRVGEKRMPLTLMEAALLRYFVQREGCPVPRKAILEEVWGLRDDTDTRAIDNFIVRLRRYIEDDPTSPRHLQTVRGVGYRFVANPE